MTNPNNGAVTTGFLTISDMPPIPKGETPMQHDMYHMGMHIGKNLMMMYESHFSEVQKYIILVNLDTGERKRIEIS